MKKNTESSKEFLKRGEATTPVNSKSKEIYCAYLILYYMSGKLSKKLNRVRFIILIYMRLFVIK